MSHKRHARQLSTLALRATLCQCDDMTTAPLLTSPEVGALLGRSSRTVHRLVEAGELKPAMKLSGPNGAYLFRAEDVQRLLSGRKTAA